MEFQKIWKQDKQFVSSMLPVEIKTRLLRLAKYINLKPSYLQALRWPINTYQRNHQLKISNEIVNFYTAYTAGTQNLSEVKDWKVLKVIPTVSDMTISLLGVPGGKPTAVLKVPRTSQSLKSAVKQVENLNYLNNNPKLEGMINVIPHIIAKGEFRGQGFIVENYVPGENSRSILADINIRGRFFTAAMEKIHEFHQATLEPIYVDHFIYSQWVGDRLNLLATAVQNLPGSKALLESIKHLKDDLQDKLIGKQFDSSWIHGDYVPGNILATKDGSEITGIIDWELAHPIELPGLDMAQFIMAAGIYTQGMEMGQIVINILKDQDMGSEIRAGLYAIEKYLPASTPDIKTLVVLAWLRHVSTNMIKSEVYMSHLYWVMENIEFVLKKIW